jgi:hypothetical protein
MLEVNFSVLERMLETVDTLITQTYGCLYPWNQCPNLRKKKVGRDREMNSQRFLEERYLPRMKQMYPKFHRLLQHHWDRCKQCHAGLEWPSISPLLIVDVVSLDEFWTHLYVAAISRFPGT